MTRKSDAGLIRLALIYAIADRDGYAACDTGPAGKVASDLADKFSDLLRARYGEVAQGRIATEFPADAETTPTRAELERQLAGAREALLDFRKRIASIADDYHPGSDKDAPLALSEMRDAISAALAGEAPDAAPNELPVIYTNWRNETAPRRLRPVGLPRIGTTEHHLETTILMACVDLDAPEKGVRDYDVAKMRVVDKPAADGPRDRRNDDPHGVQACLHPDCGRFQDGAGWSCREMAVIGGACARPRGDQPYMPPDAGLRAGEVG